MHTKDKLAAALIEAGLPEMAAKATTGWYHDYLSPLPTPDLQLAADLAAAGTPAALALRERHLAGEFDANREESDEWARSPEGQKTFAQLSGSPNRAQRRAAPPKQRAAGRLAIREQGQWVKAYYAEPDTMKGAVLLSMIRASIVREHPSRLRAFMELMQVAVSDIVEEQFGQRPVWPEGPQPAPEHERNR